MENWPQHSLILGKVSFVKAKTAKRLKYSQMENASLENAVTKQLAKEDQWHLKCPGEKQGKVTIWHIVFVETEIDEIKNKAYIKINRELTFDKLLVMLGSTAQSVLST